ncbi:FecR family protein [Filimonas effusa]|uniref:DUF4974 domain-containing protein n=1 Tax=Filimonas effusa TaxID=2508721 RepID=A0A4Q1D9I3_9BACT|nr:FecR domain-containing protein [Filimonas effusa]RXK86047.1 DUF4974 domain-containing protein [Filimonas effusa]
MTEQHLKYLLERYMNGTCTPEELAQLTQWYDSLYQQHTGFFLKGEDKKKQLSRLLLAIHQEIDLSETHQPVIIRSSKRTFGIRVGIAAAAVVLLAVSAIWWFSFSVRPQHSVALTDTYKTDTAPAVQLNWAAHENTGNKRKTLPLPDGTVAVLLPGSSMKYSPDYNTGDKRDVQVTGEVHFNVAKLKDKPFTVYSGRFATTALGTSFSVYEYKTGARIALFSGKVVVKSAGKNIKGWINDIFLQPGQAMQYNAGSGNVAVKKIEEAARQAAVSLAFEDTPLTEVLEKLSSLYRVTITYNKEDLTAMRFSGTIQSTDSLKVLLQAIAQMNGLTITPRADAYIVKASE